MRKFRNLQSDNNLSETLNLVNQKLADKVFDELTKDRTAGYGTQSLFFGTPTLALVKTGDTICTVVAKRTDSLAARGLDRVSGPKNRGLKMFGGGLFHCQSEVILEILLDNATKEKSESIKGADRIKFLTDSIIKHLVNGSENDDLYSPQNVYSYLRLGNEVSLKKFLGSATETEIERLLDFMDGNSFCFHKEEWIRDITFSRKSRRTAIRDKLLTLDEAKKLYAKNTPRNIIRSLRQFISKGMGSPMQFLQAATFYEGLVKYRADYSGLEFLSEVDNAVPLTLWTIKELLTRLKSQGETKERLLYLQRLSFIFSLYYGTGFRFTRLGELKAWHPLVEEILTLILELEKELSPEIGFDSIVWNPFGFNEFKANIEK